MLQAGDAVYEISSVRQRNTRSPPDRTQDLITKAHAGGPRDFTTEDVDKLTEIQARRLRAKSMDSLQPTCYVLHAPHFDLWKEVKEAHVVVASVGMMTFETGDKIPVRK